MRDMDERKFPALSASEKISGLIWYALCKRDAIDQMRRFSVPADGHEMRMAYSSYFVNLQSLIDRSKELFGDSLVDDWINCLDGYGEQSGEENERYIRELRNAIVHRGLNPTASAEVLGNFVLPHSPMSFPSRAGKTVTARPPDRFLLQIAFRCEEHINDIIIKHAQPHINSIGSIPIKKRSEEIIEFVRSSEFIPEEIKTMFLRNVEKIPFQTFFDNDAKALSDALNCKIHES